MNQIPSNLNLDKIIGPLDRTADYARNYRDEIVYSPTKKYFALAYTICEISMGNEVGCVAWGSITNGIACIEEAPTNTGAACWRAPWCKWVSEDTFIFKVNKYIAGETKIPCIAVNMNKGIALINGTNTTKVWQPSVVVSDLKFEQYSESYINELIRNA